MTPNKKTYFEIELDRLMKKDYLPEHYYVQIRQSKQFMEKFLSEKIELGDIASRAYMSRFNYTRIFKKVYGV